MTLLSRVVLPTPLRPIRQTTLPPSTSRSTSRRMSVSPYATCSCLMHNMVLPVLSEVNLNHFWVALHFLNGALAERLALMQNGHGAGNLPDEGHVMVNHQQRVLARHGQQEFARALGFLGRHAGHR